MNKPNILLIYSDQHRWDCTGNAGHNLIQTPNIDSLGRDGVTFNNAYTPAPICVPARNSLLSGQWPGSHGVVFNFDGETFKRPDLDIPYHSRILSNAGYHSYHIGRWHIDKSYQPHDFGFHEELIDWRYDKWREKQGISPAPSDKGRFGQMDPYITPEQSSLHWHARQVVKRLEESIEDPDPFLIHWNCVEPHLPCRPPEPYASMYNPDDIQPWPGFYDNLSNKPYIQRQMGIPYRGMTWENWAPVVSRYLGTISLLDNAIGIVLNAMNKLGLTEDTIVVYTSDHGDLCGSRGRDDKHYVMYDDVVKVPMFMRWPGVIKPATIVDDFVSNAIDLPVTFCTAAGITMPYGFQGNDLLPIINKDKSGRDSIFSTYSGNQFGAFSQRMVRTNEYKYIWNATDEDEFYDMINDPAELNNLIANDDYDEQLAEMRYRLQNWMEDIKDPLWNNGNIGQMI
jgi:arylsulfatase A-like enzyme